MLGRFKYINNQIPMKKNLIMALIVVLLAVVGVSAYLLVTKSQNVISVEPPVLKFTEDEGQGSTYQGLIFKNTENKVDTYVYTGEDVDAWRQKYSSDDEHEMSLVTMTDSSEYFYVEEDTTLADVFAVVATDDKPMIKPVEGTQVLFAVYFDKSELPGAVESEGADLLEGVFRQSYLDYRARVMNEVYNGEDADLYSMEKAFFIYPRGSGSIMGFTFNDDKTAVTTQVLGIGDENIAGYEGDLTITAQNFVIPAYYPFQVMSPNDYQYNSDLLKVANQAPASESDLVAKVKAKLAASANKQGWVPVVINKNVFKALIKDGTGIGRLGANDAFNVWVRGAGVFNTVTLADAGSILPEGLTIGWVYMSNDVRSETDGYCVDESDCGEGFGCSVGVCERKGMFVPGCDVDADCEAGEVCEDGSCSKAEGFCVDDTACEAGYECVDHLCEFIEGYCEDNGGCLEGVCDTANNLCVGCLEPADCDSGFECVENACEAIEGYCEDNGDCLEGVCDMEDSLCVDCVVDADCSDLGTAATCTNNQCACTPSMILSAGDLGDECGELDNGCGGTVDRACKNGLDCSDGICKSPLANDDLCDGVFCFNGMRCNPDDGECVTCFEDTQCEEGKVCSDSFECVCAPGLRLCAAGTSWDDETCGCVASTPAPSGGDVDVTTADDDDDDDEPDVTVPSGGFVPSGGLLHLNLD